MAIRTRVLAVVCSALCLATTPFATAKDYFLTIGGGYSPQGNQVSLEKNVLFFQRLLAEQAPAGVPHDIYFSDGDNPARDLQFEDAGVPRAHELLARLFASERYLGLHYRDTQIPGMRGGSNRENIERWFQEVGAKLTAGDRLLIYATAHGGKSADKKNAHNTKLYLWNGQSIHAGELAALLDKLPTGVRVVTVMVQCYSGGFSHLIFNEADQKKGMADGDRCGFFATVHSRPAAGCTADINEENYQEYSSHFWAAIRGKTRTEQAVDVPDFNEDGVVSFDEAHAHALLVSDSIDISIKTSGAFLRAYSKTSGKPDVIAADAPYSKIAELATPAERAVLDGLSTQLGLTGEDRAAQAKQQGDALQQERKKLADKQKKLKTDYDRRRKAIQAHVRDRWPEVANVLNPEITELVSRRPAEFVQLVESHKDFSEWERLHEQIEAISTERLDLDRRWARCQRYLRTAENIALAANLDKFASPELLDRYARLIALEHEALRLVNRGQ